ncbi:hypothetical protein UAY_00829 [Enterococcus moraviensis ATCC BAA-383]|uniref:Late competence protein ComGG n=1 Tax=Enterococcus moraviensis ATCC BAA-383 TaxID=1158609 RepID=R2TS97_9ENTE|nr:competence type IV pilus minor pilin ComGG [Enterococcus moraviensis]EOI03082.1 hypothetical protein UAY_00829 [Enterococcus moraviensis ATCC BAA-383]EOT74041.1 hypothetical protein I586_01037 [Enterococcus moraviensis ATCC BAA-383]
MNKRYNGGILLTTLLLVFLFSFIFMLILEDFQLTQAFTKKTKDYYIAKIMVSMFLSDRKKEQKSFEKKGEQRYSTGILQYEYNETIVWFTIEVNQATYKFKEEYHKSKKADRLVKDEVK